MISYVIGNLFESPAQTLVNTVNTVGVMGKGVALGFKQIYPEMFREYQALCEAKQFQIGSLFLYRTPNKWVLNFPTKESWRRPSKVEYIRTGLERFREMYSIAGIRSVAFPPLGCGNGELNFPDVVRPLMEEYLSDLPIDVFIYAPHSMREVPEHRNIDELRLWLQSEPVYLPFDEVWHDLTGLVSERIYFRTLKAHSEFRASVIDEGMGIRVYAPGKTIKFTHEDVYDVWQGLRQHTVLTTRSASESQARLWSYLFPMLVQLPYIAGIAIADSLEAITMNPPLGIQLLDRPVGEVKQQFALAV